MMYLERLNIFENELHQAKTSTNLTVFIFNYFVDNFNNKIVTNQEL